MKLKQGVFVEVGAVNRYRGIDILKTGLYALGIRGYSAI
jgi:hypothetical protein